MIGRTVSHYRIVEELGRGGMGVVYKAEDTRLKRTVALKFLPADALADPAAKARLLHEAQAAAALDHQNVCTIHEIQETDDHTFIVMTFVEGESVKDKLAAGPLPLAELLDIVLQTAEGLALAHKKNIVHRDVKPANLMVTQSGQVKIMDFGLARAEGQTKLTKTGTSVGTVAYMSPEQARGEATDHRTDIWSLGVSLFEMITGRLPFRGEHEHAVLYSVLNEDPEPVTALRTGVPVELERVINKALAKSPKDRYQHVDDMLVDLRAIEKRLKAPGRAGAVPSKKRRRSLIAAAVSIVAAAAVVVIVLSQRDGGPADRAAPRGEGARIQSLAVLPLDNLMNDPDEDYFVDGMHEALITSLSKLGSLRVISRTSVMRYRDTRKPLPEIARELDVDALIEGSVLKVGDEVQITAQLIDGESDEHLWADNYVRDLRNILALFNEVAGAIAGEVSAALTPEQEERLTKARAVDPEAYDALLRGVQLFNSFKAQNVRESIAYFDKAIEIDPEFAEAYAQLAGAYAVLAVMDEPPYEVMPKAKDAAQKALALDDGLCAAHTAMGYVLLYYDRDWEGGGRAFRRAIEIDPNNGMARHGYADYLTAVGRLDESVDEVKRGRQSNPLSPMTNAVVVGHLYIARRYEEAAAEANELLAINPNYPAVNGFLQRTYWQMGKFEESLELLRKSHWARSPEIVQALDRGYAESGPPGVMLAMAKLLEAESDTAYVDPLDVAPFYARAERYESAMDWLEKAVGARSPTIIHVMLDPSFDTIRNTARFKELRRRLNLPD